VVDEISTIAEADCRRQISFCIRQACRAIDSLAVLPLANESADPDTEYLSDGSPKA